MTFRLRHLVAALVLHALVLGLLLGGMQCTRKPTRPPVIRAVLLDPDRKEIAQRQRLEEQRRQEQRREQQRRKTEAEQRQREQEQRRLVEEQRRAADLQKRRLAEEQKRLQAEELKRQRELAERKKAEEQARRKQEQEALRERQEQAQRELQEKARLEEALREEAMRHELEREAAARAASERELRQAEWADVLQRHVQKYWIRTSAGNQDFECTVNVQMLPDGTVTSARIAKSCGSAPLDKSVEDAVYRSSPMPRPADPSVFDRELIITFRPRL